MKYLYYIFGYILLLMIYSCTGGSGISLSTPAGLVDAQKLFEEKFGKYTAIRSLYVSTDDMRKSSVDIMSVQYEKDSKVYTENYLTITDKNTDPTAVVNPTASKTFTPKAIDFSILTNALNKATALIMEKDKGFSNIRIQKCNFDMDNDAKMKISFDVLAEHQAKSYYGKRKALNSKDFQFSFELDKNNNAVATSGLTLN